MPLWIEVFTVTVLSDFTLAVSTVIKVNLDKKISILLW